MHRGLSPFVLLGAIVAQACSEISTEPRGPAPAGTVTIGMASQLAFVTQALKGAVANTVISPPVRVLLRDSLGNTVAGATDSVTVVLATNPSGAILLGKVTVAAVDGVATFADLQVDRPGMAYTLAATTPSLDSATSAPFDVHVTFRSVEAGYVHSCGVTVSGAAYCWGDNSMGQLGDGAPASPWYRSSPAPVGGGLGGLGGLQFTMISAGVWHTCGVTTSGGAYCWGDNLFGQLGDGTTEGRATPTPVAGGLRFLRLSAGSRHTCGITTSGAAYCWGDNQNAQLGDGTTDRRVTPVPVKGGFTFTTLSAGHGHTCGVMPSGVALCWGDNSSGQLGGGTALDRVAYRPYPGPVVHVRGFTSVSAGNVHTCGVTTRGEAYCWGYNVWGQLGDGTTIQRSVPVRVAGRLRFTGVDAGSYFSCGVASGGQAYCWGENVDGELGDGTTVARTSPTLVAQPVAFATMRAGWYHVCALNADTGAYCWGYNGHGQLGEGSTNPRYAPAVVVQ